MDQATSIASLLNEKPWAGFLALCVVAITVLFVALVRSWGKLSDEQRAHLETAREVANVAKAITENWHDQLAQNQKTLELHERGITLIEGRTS